MEEGYIGVGSFRLHMSRPNEWLKRYALFFDRFEIVDFDHCLWMHKHDSHGKASTVADLEWLVDQGIIGPARYVEVDASKVSPDDSATIAAARERLDAERDALAGMNAVFQSEFSARGNLYPQPPDLRDKFEEYVRRGWDLSARLAHQATLNLRATREANAVCLEAKPATFAGSLDNPVSDGELYTFIVQGITIPDKKIPWGDILAFRQEEASRSALRDLRLWLGGTAKGKWSFGEAEEQLKQMQTDYQRHVRGSGFKGALGALEAIVVGTAELAENLAKLRLKALAEMPFKAIRSGMTAADEIRKAPGRELSYLASIERQFVE